MIALHVLEELSVFVQGREALTFPGPEVVLGEIRIEFRTQSERGRDRLCRVTGAVEGARVDTGDRGVIRFDPRAGCRRLARTRSWSR